MEIVHYDEVDDRQMTELTLACFEHAYSKERVSEMVENDRRIPEWGGELYAVEDGKALGTLGMLFPRARTKERVEVVGGIRNVCTRPSASQEGIAKKLLAEAHSRMEERGVRFSFLMTSSSLLAHGLYRKLGYRDIHSYPAAFKQEKEGDTNIVLREEADEDHIRSTYMKSMRDLLGLVEREEGFMDMAEARGWPDDSHIRTAYEDGKKIGYIMYHENKRQVEVSELAVEREEDILKLLNALEAETHRRSIVIFFVNPAYYTLLREAGYNIYDDRWGRIMIKDFEEEYRETMDLFGKGKRFHAGVYESY